MSARVSPLHDELIPAKSRPGAKWIEVEGMPVPQRLWDSRREQELHKTIAMTDASFLPRMTVKGPRAVAWLAEQGVFVPAKTLGVARTANGGLLARTGGAEVFLEDVAGGKLVDWLRQALSTTEPGAYGVLRQDAAMVIAGEKACELFRHVSSFDFVAAANDSFVFTPIAGVSCSVLKETVGGRKQVRLWTDGTYGAYVWHTLLEVARELGGGAVGVETFFPEVL